MPYCVPSRDMASPRLPGTIPLPGCHLTFPSVFCIPIVFRWQSWPKVESVVENAQCKLSVRRGKCKQMVVRILHGNSMCTLAISSPLFQVHNDSKFSLSYLVLYSKGNWKELYFFKTTIEVHFTNLKPLLVLVTAWCRPIFWADEGRLNGNILMESDLAVLYVASSSLVWMAGVWYVDLEARTVGSVLYRFNISEHIWK